MVDVTRAKAAFLTANRARNLAPTTQYFYRWGLGFLPGYGELPFPLERLELTLAQASAQLTPESLHNLWRILRRFGRWTAQRYRIENTAQDLDEPQRPTHRPKTLSTAEISQVLAACHRRRDRMLVLVLLDTGIRLAELAAIHKQDLSPETLRVTGKGRKVRHVPISREVLHDLLLEGDKDRPWLGRHGRALSRGGVQLAFRRIFARANVHGGPHALRHTFAFRYIMAGGDVFSLQRILGHSDVATSEIYVRMQTQDLVDQHRRFSPARDFIAAARRLL